MYPIGVLIALTQAGVGLLVAYAHHDVGDSATQVIDLTLLPLLEGAICAEGDLHDRAIGGYGGDAQCHLVEGLGVG